MLSAGSSGGESDVKNNIKNNFKQKMRLKKLFSCIAAVILLFITQKINSQDDLNSGISTNLPMQGEMQSSVKYEISNTDLEELDRSYKSALERGNESKAEELKSEMYRIIPAEKIYKVKSRNWDLKIIKQPEIPEGDWSTGNQRIHYGSVNHANGFFKMIDMKMGEDNNLYSAVCKNEGSYASIVIYKSSNYGTNWAQVIGISIGDRVTNISMIVESRNNLVPDSTRIIIFHTNSSDYINFNNSDINYFSVKSNGTNYSYGQIAAPDPGNLITGISAVSDGAYWQGATYFGVVCTEADNITKQTKKIRFFRTIDWGATWVGSVLNTSFNDKYPNAGYKEGTSDSVYIAVERSFDSLQSQIRVIATPWIPSANFKTYYVTSVPNVKYEKPCLTVRQNNPALSVMITCTKNNIPLYHYTNNGGSSWETDYSLNTENSSKKLYTYCSSAANGPAPFTTSVLNTGMDSINIRKGILGSLGNTIHKVNSSNSQNYVTPVCESIYRDGKNYSIVTYAGTESPYGNTYCAQEGLKKLNIKMIIQGYYNPSTNSLTASDTVTVYLRNTVSPYSIADSVKSVLINNLLSLNAELSSAIDGNYYVSIKHRNSIDIWSKDPVDFTIPGDKAFDFRANSNAVYGDNEIQVDNTPVQFAMYSGDVNRDGIIDLTDVIRISNDAGEFKTGYQITDLTGNSVTDLTDVVMAFNNASSFVSVKKP